VWALRLSWIAQPVAADGSNVFQHIAIGRVLQNFCLIDDATRVSSYDKVCNWWNIWNMAESRLPDVEILPWHKDLEIVKSRFMSSSCGGGGTGGLAVPARICRMVYSVDDSTSYVPQPYALSMYLMYFEFC
jgi:hypothetical protein